MPHDLAKEGCFLIIGGLVTYQSEKTKKKMKTLMATFPQLKFWGKVVGGAYAASCLIILLYATYQLTVEHDGLLFFYRLAVYGCMACCVLEMAMFLLSRKFKVSPSAIVLSAAHAAKASPLFFQFLRVTAPLLLLAYGVVSYCSS